MFSRLGCVEKLTETISSEIVRNGACGRGGHDAKIFVGEPRCIIWPPKIGPYRPGL